MSDKKEVLDYLRNRQKAAEIEAKVNGINLWVLFGAIGLVSWQLIVVFDDVALLAQRELALRILVMSEALYLFGWSCLPTPGIRHDLRYVRWGATNAESSVTWVFIESLGTLLPPALLWAVVGHDISVYVLGAFGGAMAVASTIEIVGRATGSPKKEKRFPEPFFSSTPHGDAVGDLVIGGAFVVAAIVQGVAIARMSPVTTDVVKMVALLVVLYLLIMVAFRRHRRSQGIQWTYELETDVLVGAVSPEVAVRRIEHRALGPRLEDVMNTFFDEFDRKLANFESIHAECQGGLQAVKEVPSEFPDERKARLERATAGARDKLKELRDDIQEFSAYVERLEKKKADSRVAATLQSLVTKRDVYKERVQTAKANFETLVNNASSLS